MKTTPLIGLEVHVEFNTESKMFCSCPADHFGKKPNTQTCPVCLGLPGALPIPNEQAIKNCIKIGLALNCKINKLSKFDRKQYFYPDLPKGYQISQYDQPFCTEGYITLDSGKKIGIERVHQEEDTGKLQHISLEGKKVTLIDFNRSGVPLAEIVSKPDMSSSSEAKEYLKKIHELVRALGVSDADMEKGQMRLEPTVNVKIEDENGMHYTPLVEVKNINSFNFAAQAIDFEVKRQVEEFKKTGIEKTASNKTTRGYDSVKKLTFLQRTKEEAKDYRYFPEPDIPPYILEDKFINTVKDELPQLPGEVIAEMVNEGVEPKYAKIIYANKASLKAYLESKDGKSIDKAKLASFIANKKIDTKGNIEKQYAELTTVGNTNEVELSGIIQEILDQNPSVVAEYKKGKTNVAGYFVGLAMRETKGKADPQTLNKLVRKLLED